MKKSLNIIVFAVILLMVYACGPKNDESTTASNTPVVAVAAKSLTVAEKRARIAEQKAAQAEKRRIAYEAWVKNHPTYIDSDGNVVYSKAEVDPSYAGGEAAMEKFLNDNVTYPQEAKDRGDEGTVFVDFIVSSDGVVREVEATDEAGDNMDQSLRDEAVRLVVSMPRWNPGRQNGKPVPVKYSLPVTFMLN